MSFLGSTGPTIPTVVTYRHLLSPAALTVFNPLRTIAHCDIDAAYAQFEQVRLGLPDDIPLICAQWQSIIAVNYPARKYGIKRFNTIDEAKKMCPHLTVQHVATYRNGEAEAGYWGEVDPRTHKVSLDPYRRESLKILAIFKEMIPKGEIEKASIDEAFLDLTPMVLDKLLQYHSQLSVVPEDAVDGVDTPLPSPPPIDWTKAGNVVPINGGKEGESADERIHQDTWEDWALCVGAEIMAELRAEVWKKLHYTCSAGIAHNKAIAKKPNAQTVLRSAATPAFLRDMDFTDIRMLGGKLGTSIANEFNVKTVGDLLTISLEEMQKRFGEESIWVYNIARGIDHSEVTSRVSTKSMLASKNTRPAVTTPEQGLHWIKILAGELHVRLRESREVTPGIWPKSLVLGHRTGIESAKHRQIPFPFTRNLNTEYIVKFAKKLWEEVCQPMSRGGMKLNNMSLSFAGLERMEEGQRGIEGFFGTSSATNASRPSVAPITPNASPPKPIPAKRSRSPSTPELHSGNSTGQNPSPAKRRLPTLHTGKSKRPLEGFFTRNGESSKGPQGIRTIGSDPPAESTEVIVLEDDDRNESAPEQEGGAGQRRSTEIDGGWTCPRCQKVITAPNSDQSTLTESKQEHEDFHFALDLQNGSSPQQTARVRAPAKPGANAKKKADGIKAFFAPKSAVKKEE